MIRTVCFLFALLIFDHSYAQKFPVDTIYKTGPLEKRINVVILGDGFTESQLPEFRAEARNFADFILAYEPYNHYKHYFNFFAIPTPSKESGVTNPGTAPDAYPDQPVETKDTFYGASFGGTIHRLVTVEKSSVIENVLALNMPQVDLTVVLVNTPFYGGSGGSYAVYTLHPLANTIGVHEIGHTFSSLSDEYWAGTAYGQEAQNMTAESRREAVKWKNWLNETRIGVFSYGEEGDAARWFKPSSSSCLMEFLDQPFCAVCREGTTERILQIVNPVEKVLPDTSEAVILSESDQTFELGLLDPEPNTLKVEWKLNGKPIGNKHSKLNLSVKDLPADNAVLTATVFDSTFLSRQEEARTIRTHAVQWQLASSNAAQVFRLKVSENRICLGSYSMITAAGCMGTVSWSTGESAESITVKPVHDATYTATCSMDGQPLQTLDATITVLPLPTATAVNGGPYYEGSAIQLEADGGTAFLWNGPEQFGSLFQNPVIENATARNAGIYEVKVTDANGCSATAQTEVKVDPILATGQDLQAWVRISPNPAKDFIRVKTALHGESQLDIYDLNGRKVASRSFHSETEINLNVSAGLYIYKFTNGPKEVSGKLLLH
ncbi:M64 family metallopeptidase [Dyadobacter sediminis]|uniref:T9SS type A sorting domain-containing protein n=1 Tax=Dyadobacter sediminis TaxID=1493691 RepID=A0A5R9KJD1_9BACT|nr:M64 family metallopeptidase [Dyadobacter sediminis]TLU96328.1 T9SS type A sorting domain-containing protein [Dyadobacter sediminis]GGB81310.1 hypothetical protein GCM10011325_05970 [Dyadobacter sediminis]